MRAQQAAQHVGHRQRQRNVPPDIALEGEQQQGRQVGGGVDQLGRGRGVQKVVAQPAHKQEHQKAAGTRAEEAVVKADHQTDGAGRQRFGAAGKARCMVTAQLFFGQGVEQNAEQDQRQQLA